MVERSEVLELMEANAMDERLTVEKATEVAMVLLQKQAGEFDSQNVNGLVLGIAAQMMSGSMADRTIDAAVAEAKKLVSAVLHG